LLNLNQAPRVSVIVLNYNGRAYVERCLRSLFRNTYPYFEVLFVDNDSSDKSADLAEELFRTEPNFILIRNPKNYGFSIGNNIGFQRADSEYVISLNNDTEVEETFIETLVNEAESDERIGSVGCKIVQVDGRILYGPIYTSFGFIVRAFYKETYEKETANLGNCGCAVLFRKSVIGIVGAYDPYLCTDWEDHDLGYRINSAGFKCVYTPKTKVLHLGGGNYLGMSRERQIRIIRNRLFTYLKNYESANILVRFPLISVMEAVIYLKHKKLSLFLNGVSEALRRIGPILHKRSIVQSIRKKSDKQIFASCNSPENPSLWKTLRHL
jgi:GT2 family glycosyltransferase